MQTSDTMPLATVGASSQAVDRQCELLAFRQALRDRRRRPAFGFAGLSLRRLGMSHPVSICRLCQGEAEAALTTKLHRQFRAEGDRGPHDFWSIYHKDWVASPLLTQLKTQPSTSQEDSKWTLPAQSSLPLRGGITSFDCFWDALTANFRGQEESSNLYRTAYNRQVATCRARVPVL